VAGYEQTNAVLHGGLSSVNLKLHWFDLLWIYCTAKAHGKQWSLSLTCTKLHSITTRINSLLQKPIDIPFGAGADTRGRRESRIMGIGIGAIWRIRLNDPCSAAMRAVATVTVAQRIIVIIIIIIIIVEVLYFPDLLGRQTSTLVADRLAGARPGGFASHVTDRVTGRLGGGRGVADGVGDASRRRRLSGGRVVDAGRAAELTLAGVRACAGRVRRRTADSTCAAAAAVRLNAVRLVIRLRTHTQHTHAVGGLALW